MRILLAGRNGQVGYELERALAPLGEVCAFDHRQMDLADESAIVSRIGEVKPDVIVNAAAYTNVDAAESDRAGAMRVNAEGPAILAAQARATGALLVHYSTDYVFDGHKTAPYSEDDAPNPQSAYGESKLAGERAVQAAGGRYLIFRTSWVYGPRGRNFFLTILRLARERDELRVVNDQVGAPTPAHAVAAATADVLRARGDVASGLFHVAAGGQTTWFGFAEAILDLARTRLRRLPQVVPISAVEYAAPAARPANSVLDCAKAATMLGVRIAHWRACLDEVWRQLPPQFPGDA